MLVVISPAKTLDFESKAPVETFTQGALLDQSQLLIERAKQLSMQDIASLMKVSDKIAGLNAARFGQWSFLLMRAMPSKLYLHLKAMFILEWMRLVYQPKRLVTHKSIYACYQDYTAYCVR